MSEGQWERLKPLLPPQKPRTGRPALDHRTILEGILHILRTGAPWRDMPAEYGSWRTVYSRFSRWQKQGVWDKVFGELLKEADAEGQIDWSRHYVDATVVRAHQHGTPAD